MFLIIDKLLFFLNSLLIFLSDIPECFNILFKSFMEHILLKLILSESGKQLLI